MMPPLRARSPTKRWGAGVSVGPHGNVCLSMGGSAVREGPSPSTRESVLEQQVGVGARPSLAVALLVVAALGFGCSAKERKRPAEEKVGTNAAAVVASVDVATFAIYADKS